MITLENVSKNYGYFRGCKEISFKVSQGEVTALVGPNGAGKTTILKMLSGILLPTSGNIQIDTFDISEFPLEAREITGSLFENTPLYSDMTVRNYLSFIAGMHGLSGKKARTSISDALDSCNLGDVANRLIGTLSRGYRQRASLAQALLHNPSILILDEPTSGLDPLQLEEFRKIILSLKNERTILLSTHIMQEVESLCSVIVMIHQGVLVEQGSIKDICKRNGVDSIERAFLNIVSQRSKGEIN